MAQFLEKNRFLAKTVGDRINSCKTLYTPAECAFLGVLDLAVPEGYRVFSKMRLADLIKVRPRLKASARQAAFNRISRKHVDFVLKWTPGGSI